MISVQEALRLVLEDLVAVGAERVMLRGARGRVLAEPIVATRDVPSFRNSAMDGYAVRAADMRGVGEKPVRLRILEVIGAGASPTHVVEPGTATKIMTGSPMPAGADAVVIMTAWDEFRALRPEALAARLRGRTVIDPYAVLDAGACRAAGLEHVALGAPAAAA